MLMTLCCDVKTVAVSAIISLERKWYLTGIWYFRLPFLVTI